MAHNKKKAQEVENTGGAVGYSYTNTQPGNMTRRRKLASLVAGGVS